MFIALSEFRENFLILGDFEQSTTVRYPSTIRCTLTAGNGQSACSVASVLPVIQGLPPTYYVLQSGLSAVTPNEPSHKIIYNGGTAPGASVSIDPFTGKSVSSRVSILAVHFRTHRSVCQGLSI